MLSRITNILDILTWGCCFSSSKFIQVNNQQGLFGEWASRNWRH